MELIPVAAKLLLDDNLVWSEDMEIIRKDLGQMLISIDRYLSTTNKQLLQPNLDNLVYNLTADELDITIPSVINEYKGQ
jgi:hypothetical protein